MAQPSKNAKDNFLYNVGIGNYSDAAKNTSLFDPLHLTPSTAMKNIEQPRQLPSISQITAPLYKSADYYNTKKGNPLTDDKSQAARIPASVSLDKKTGTVKISASSDFLGSDVYKNNYKPILEGMSQTYRQNPEAKFALDQEGDEWNGSEKTVEEWVDALNSEDAQNGIPKVARAVESTYAEIRGLNESMFTPEEIEAGKGWTENDIIRKYQTVFETDDIKHRGSDLQALPQTKEWKEYLWNLFSKAGINGYDGESGTITREGWEQWYNRENTDKQDIRDLYIRLRQEFHDAVDAKDPTRIANASALLSTIESEDPEVGNLAKVMDGLSGFGVGVLNAGADWASSFYGLLFTPVREGVKFVGGLIGQGEDFEDDIDNLFGEYTNIDDNMQDIADYQREMSKAWGSQIATGQALGEVAGEVGKIALSIWAGNRLGEAFGTIASGALGKAIQTFSSTDKAGKIVKGVVNGVDAGLNLQKTTQFVSTANRAIGMVRQRRSLGQLAFSAITKTSELIGETIAECVVSDPKLTYRFLANSDDEEARQYVIENMAWNAGGWATARVAGEAMKGAAKTAPGQFANRQVTKASMRARTFMADMFDFVRAKMPGRSTLQKVKKARAELAQAGDGASVKLRNKVARLEKQLETEKQNHMLREAAKGITSSKGVDEFTQAKLHYMELQNAVDMRNAAQAYFFAEIRDNKTIATALGDVDDSVAEIAKALQKDGIIKEIYAEAGEFGLKSGLAYMDKKTANYISAVIDNSYLKNYLNKYGSTTRLVKQQQANNEMIRHFLDNASEELKLAADTAITRIQNFWSKYNDWATSQGIYNKAQIESLKASELWGRGGTQYARLQRVTEAYVPYSQRQIVKNRDIMGELKSRVMGSSDDYKDPILTIYNNLIGDAYDFAMKNYQDTIKQIPGIYKTMNKVVDAESTEFARKIQATGKQSVQEVSRSVETVVKGNSFDYESEFGRRAQAEIKKAVELPDLRKEASRDARRLSNLENRSAEAIQKLRTNSTQRRNTLMSLSAEQLDNVATPAQVEILNRGNALLNAQDALSTLSAKSVAELDEAISNIGYVGVNDALALVQDNVDDFETWMSTLSKDAQTKVRQAIRSSDAVGDVKKVTGEDFIKAMESVGGVNGENATSLAHTIDSIVLEDTYPQVQKTYDDTVKSVSETDAVKRLASEQLHQSQIAQAETVSVASQKRYNDALAELRKEYDAAKTFEGIDSIIDDMVDEAWSRPGVQEAFTAPTSGTMDSVDAGKNLVLTELGRTKTVKNFKAQVADAFKKETKDSFKQALKGEKTPTQIEKMVNEAANSYADLAEERLMSRAADARTALQDAGSQFSNVDDMFDEARNLVGKIEGYSEEIRRGTGANVVRILNEDGAAEFYEVSPAMASFFNTRPHRHIDTGRDRFLRSLSSIFRSGTTGGLAVKSFMNQWVKDSGNAWVAGNAFRSIKKSEKLIANIFGDDIAKAFRDWTPDELRILGLDNIEDAQELAARELERGRAFSPTTTEYSQYQFSRQQRARQLANAGFQGLDEMTNIKTWGAKAQEIISDMSNKTEKLADMRESYLRNRVYANAYADAIKQGYSIKDARTTAQFLMNNATTNFGRALTHLENLRSTVPYIGAAINGTKSFFRVAELDPVGVMSRIIGGFIVPVVALTAHNLSSEENRKLYANIPEWQRASSFCFILNGEVMTLPLPEQVADIIAPWRQFVEYLSGAQRGTFQELLLNDLVGFSPVDFTGFTSVDIDQIYTKPEDFWKKRLTLGSARLLSQFSDPLTKAGIIWATGIDPYTGNYVDNTYYATDDDGNLVAVDYNSGWLANKISEIMNGVTGGSSTMSAAMAQKLMQTLLGNANVEVLDGLSELAGAVGNLVNTGDFGAFLNEVGEGPVSSFIEEATSPFYTEVYDRALSDWRHAISSLEREKDAILGDEKFQTLLSRISTESNPDKLATLKAQRQNYIDDFQTKVLNVAKDLKNKYPSAVFDKYKFASVLNLMNMNANARGTNVYAETAMAQSLTKDQKKQGQMMAYNTMLSMGFPDIEGRELTGYISDEFGERKVVYANPLSILAYSTTKQLQKDIHLANIEAIISEKDWYDKRAAVKQQINAIYNKGKLKSSDYDKIDAIRIAYNGELMKDLAPYIKTYTPEMVLGSQDVMNLLAQWIQAPTGTLGYTKNKTSIKGNAQDAYIENYIKAIFEVNDSTYVGGKDYSGRGQWWKGQQ